MGTARDLDGGPRGGWLPILHPTFLAAAIALFGASVVFDVIAQRMNDQFVYAQGSFVLVGLGIGLGVVAVVFLVAEIAGLPPGEQRRQGRIHLAVIDGALLWFLAAELHRRPTSLAPQAIWISVLSAIVVLALLVSHVLDLRQVEASLAAGSDPSSAPSE